MLPNSRGKRLLEMSLDVKAVKKTKANEQVAEDASKSCCNTSFETGDQANVSLLDISTSQLIGFGEDIDFSFSVDEDIAISTPAPTPRVNSPVEDETFSKNHAHAVPPIMCDQPPNGIPAKEPPVFSHTETPEAMVEDFTEPNISPFVASTIQEGESLILG